MTKKEFTEAVIAKSGLTKISKADAQKVVDAVFGVVADELKDGKKVTLNGIGILESVDKPESTSRNPRTGESIAVPAHKAVKFKASKTLKDALNA